MARRKNKFLKVDAAKGATTFVRGVEDRGRFWEDMSIAGSPAWLLWMTEYETQLTDPDYVTAMLEAVEPLERVRLTIERSVAAKESYHTLLRLPREELKERLRAKRTELIAKARELAEIRREVREIRAAV